jgi:hypothetical protein
MQKPAAQALITRHLSPVTYHSLRVLRELRGEKKFLNHGRRFPPASIEQAFSIRRLCASGCLAESIQLIKSLRSIGVRSLHWAFALGVAARAV